MNKIAKKQAVFLMNVYSYIRNNNLDAKKAIEIQKALRALNAKDSSIEYSELLIDMMDIFDRMVMSEAVNIGKRTIN
jgi:hypothetical protein